MLRFLFIFFFTGLACIQHVSGQRTTPKKPAVKQSAVSKPAVQKVPAPAVIQDTLIKKAELDTTAVPEGGLTEKEADELAEKAAKTAKDTIDAYKIKIEDISYLSVCPGTTVHIPFTTEGPFDDENTYIAHLIDASGKSIAISLPGKKSPLKAVIPSYKIGGEVYHLQVVSNISVIKSQLVPIRLLQTPVARIEVIDGTQAARIMPGQEAHLKVNLSGTAPWSFQLSDSSNVLNTMSNPHYLIVKPTQIKAYKIMGVSNACGSGTMSGEAIVNVDNNPEPKLELKETDKIARVCNNIPFQVPFSATGKFNKGNRFVVQIADRTGAFKNLSTPDSSGYISTQIPETYKPGEYRLRVTSSAPYLVSQVAKVTIVSPTTTILQKDSLFLNEDQTGELTVAFNGGGPPWFVLLSDGTYENNIQESPYKVKVKPYYDTNYQITSAGGLCGVGKFSGRAKVAVKTPPVAIILEKLSQNMVCSGATLEIPYKTVGRYNPGNKFVVQVTDKNGRFVDLPTTITPTTMNVKLTSATSSDTIRTHKIRIISSSPAVSSAVEEIDIIAPNKAVGEVSGKGIITAGRSTRIQLKFKNGLPPWSFTLSDGTAINGTFLNPYLISVTPGATTEYKLTSVKSGCGTGTGKGSAIITVEN
ncbi:hypothetical protein [Dyadobacter sp. CY312]|uniref:hypothetical protein n=1 Tax=Dyadobacter sp. CY312 TaxID=2907303 RepID=UPI001F1FFA39|nr:hypothetical protein [Dyadobacter sp. CY312]MCE7041226.1 hypothetical protein [Dyadobacter sp. CY312]